MAGSESDGFSSLSQLLCKVGIDYAKSESMTSVQTDSTGDSFRRGSSEYERRVSLFYGGFSVQKKPVRDRSARDVSVAAGLAKEWERRIVLGRAARGAGVYNPSPLGQAVEEAEKELAMECFNLFGALPSC